MRLRTRLLLGYGVILALLIVISVVTYLSLTSLTHTVVWVSHAQEIIGKARLVTDACVDMEAGQRGFLITGNEELLEPYTNGKNNYTAAMNDLKKLIADEPTQVERLRRIESLVARWKSTAEPQIAERRKVVKGAIDADYLQAVLGRGVGKGILDTMRELMNDMIHRFRIDGNVRGEALTEHVAKAMVDQETGQRGFLITGKKEFLEPYRQGQISLKKSLSALRALVANAHDRIGTVRDLNKLEKLSEEWLRKAGNPEIELRREVDAGRKTKKDLEEALRRGTGKDMLDSMRSIMDRMDEMFERAENEKANALLLRVGQAMVDQATGQRGFIITGKDEFLEPFNTGRKVFETALNDLRKLNANAYSIPRMQRDIQKLEQLGADWQQKAAGPEIAARERMNKSQTSMRQLQTMIEKGSGTALISSIRNELGEFVRVEEGVLDRRHKESDTTASRGVLIVTFGAFLAIVLSIVTALLISRSIVSQVGGEPAMIAGVADAVAAGNLNPEIPHGSHKATGILASIMAMITALRSNRDQTESQDWLKTGIARLNDTMRGDPDVATLGSKVISEVSKHLDAQMGAFYLAGNGDGSELSLVGSYAYTKRKSLSNVFKPGEGLVGQAALEKQQILVKNVPEDYVKVTSALGERVPRFICVTPALHEGKVKGVVEIGTLSEITTPQLDYLAQAVPALAVAIESAQARTRLADSLEESQRLSEELQAQQEELQVTNEELQEQTQRLKESEERLKEQQEELQVTNEELEEKNELTERQKSEVERARQDIEEKAEELALASKYKSEFLANMSHELRTPLNSLLLLAQGLAGNKGGNLSEDQVESARIIHSSGSDLLNLINEILDLSKIEAGRMDLLLSDVNVGELAEHLRTAFEHMAKEKGLSMEVIVHEDAPARITSDSKRVKQVLRNLVSNAVKFTERGNVSVTFGQADPNERFTRSTLSAADCLAVTVRDTGIGIPPEQQKIIFEAFQQADGGTARRFGGTGLGLSISRELAQLLGGEIHLQSVVGEGSTFTLYLPFEIKRPPSAANEKPEAESQNSPCVEPTAAPGSVSIPDDRESLNEGDRSILVIEDDPTFARLLHKKCHDKGFKCLATPNGEAGLELAAKHLPAAVILDIRLPGMNGWGVLSALKENIRTRHIPVHIISAEEATTEALRKGAIGHVTKPLDQAALDETFARLDEVSAGKPGRVLVVEDDDQLRRATVDLIGGRDVRVDEARNGTEALKALRAETYDCVVTDLGLPDMDGSTMLATLKRERVPLPPVIVHTARDLTVEQEASLREHAESVVIKDVRSHERLLDEVSLFLHRVVSQMPEPQQRVIHDLHDTDALLQDKKVLVVDDDMRTTFAVSRLLSERGMKTLKAENGEKALRMLEQEPDVDLVLMDIMMPVMDGYEAMRRIRETQHVGRKVPIIALTAKAMPEDRRKCVEAGANDYLPKPVDPQRLISMLRVWMHR